jgi:hypothetical protein
MKSMAANEVALARIAKLGSGPARVMGRAIMRDPMRAPLSGRPCLYYQVRGRNHRRPWYDYFYYPPEGARFELEDESGRIWVNVPPRSNEGPVLGGVRGSAFCEIAGDVFRRTIYEGESPELDRFLDPGRFADSLDAYIEAEEHVIVEGDLVTAMGEVVEEITPDGTSLGYRSPPMRLVLWVQKLHV